MCLTPTFHCWVKTPCFPQPFIFIMFLIVLHIRTILTFCLFIMYYFWYYLFFVNHPVTISGIVQHRNHLIKLNKSLIIISSLISPIPLALLFSLSYHPLFKSLLSKGDFLPHLQGLFSNSTGMKHLFLEGAFYDHFESWGDGRWDRQTDRGSLPWRKDRHHMRNKPNQIVAC